MKILTVLIVFSSSLILNAVGNSIYQIIQNVNGTSTNLTSRYRSSSVMSGEVGVTQCSNYCSQSVSCVSAVVDISEGICDLYTITIPADIQAGATSVIYIEDKCRAARYQGQNLPECCKRNGGTIYQDCQEAFDQGETVSGVYYISPYSMNSTEAFQTFCEFDSESESGWTVMQRRLDGSVDFYRNYSSYKEGFGDLTGEYWLGLDNIHDLTLTNQRLRIYMEDHEGNSRTANYSHFSIQDYSQNYRCQIYAFEGDSWFDALTMPNSTGNMDGQIFSTYDNDNIHNCAELWKGGFWYNECYDANPNGLWVDNGTVSDASGIVWYNWKGLFYSLRKFKMMLGR